MKKELIRKIVLCGIITCFVLYVKRFQIFNEINACINIDYVLEELSMEEKVEDFEAFYTTLAESVPFQEDIEALYNINFVDRKEYYRGEVEATKNNFEFFCVMKAISKEIPSFHTDICFPFYENLQGLACYDSEEIVNWPGTKARIDAWFEEIGDYVWEYQEMGFLSAVYVDGDYIVTGNTLQDSYGDLENWKLVTVDGIDTEQYVTERISVFDLHFDSANDKPYRDRVVFNDSVGSQVETVWKGENGEEITLRLYADCGAEVVAGFGYIFTGVGCPSALASVETYRDDENQLEYMVLCQDLVQIKMGDFSY